MSYTLVASKDLKDLFPRIGHISGLSTNSIISISSLEHSFYTLYTPSPSEDNFTIVMSEDFLTLNHIPQGLYKVESCLARDLKRLVIQVTKLEWDIIGDRQSTIEQSFLNHAQVVWNGLIVPFYYSQFEKVNLKCVCGEGVWKLTENSELLVEYFQEGKQKEEVAGKEEVWVEVEQLNVDRVDGYDDEIYLSQNTIQEAGLEVGKYYQLVPEEHHLTYLNNFHEFVSRGSKQQEHRQTTYARIKPTSSLKAKAFCSGFFLNNFKLAPVVKIEDAVFEGSDCVCLSNEYFLSSECKIFVFMISTSEDIPIPKKPMPLHERVLASSQIFYNNKLMVIEGKFFLTRIQNLQKLHNLSSTSSIRVLRVNNTKVYEGKSKDKALEESARKIKVSGYSMYLVNTSPQQRTSHSQIINRNLKQGEQRDSQDQTYRLFQRCYSKELEELQGHISKSQDVLVASNNKNGKSLLNKVLNWKGIKTFYMDFEEISNESEKLKDILDYLELVFQQYSDRVIYIDNVHVLCKDIQSDLHRQNEMISSKVLARHLIQFMAIYSTASVIITTTSLDILDQELQRADLAQIHLKNPSGETKREIIHSLGVDFDKANEVTKYVEGMSLGQVVSKISTKERLLSFYDNQVFGNKDRKEEINDFSKVAGLDKAKQIILETIETPFKYYSLYKHLDIKLPRGILLYGSSGVGKTFLANAVKDQMRMKFFEVKGSDILNKYIGASQQAVRDIFEKAASVSPSVVFFDEFESICPRRNSQNTGVNDRVVNQFLCYLDGVSSIEGVFIIAASSRPEMIDPALLRPGRIDKHVYLEYPSEQQRKHLLKIFQGSIQFQFDESHVVSKTQHYSYSDMIGLIKQLRIKKSNQVIKGESVDKSQFKKISLQFFDNIQGEYRIAVAVKEQQKQEKRLKKFANKEPESVENQKSILM